VYVRLQRPDEILVASPRRMFKSSLCSRLLPRNNSLAEDDLGIGTWSSGGTASGLTSMSWSAIGAGSSSRSMTRACSFPGLQAQLTTSSATTYK
jgi:hypothetical protein